MDGLELNWNEWGEEMVFCLWGNLFGGEFLA